MKFLANYIMQGRFQAMTVASSLALLSLLFSPVSIVSSASVALVTLRRGAGEGLYILAISCIATALLGVLLLGSYQFALLYGLVLWLPVWLISIVLREGRHLSVAVEIAVALGALGVIGFYLYHPDPYGLWSRLMGQMVQPVLDNAMDAPVEEIKQRVEWLSRLMTGGIAAGSVAGLLFGLFLGRWWQAVLFNPGGFRSEFLSLRAHPQIAVLAMVLMLAAFFLNGVIAEVSQNLLVLLFIFFLIIGAAALHASFSKMKRANFMVPFLYITVLMIPHVAIGVALYGLLDNWLNLRKTVSN